MKKPEGKSPYFRKGKTPYRYSERVRKLSTLCKNGEYSTPEANKLRAEHLAAMGITLRSGAWARWRYSNAT